MNFKIKKRISLLLILFFVCIMAGLPLFQSNAQMTGGFQNPLQAKSFTQLIEGIIDWVYSIGIVIAVLVIVYSGFLFMVSGGNEEKVTKAKRALMWSLIGLAVLLVGKGWVSIIQELLGGTTGTPPPEPPPPI